jgi:glycosyltransferase involved in cell wall biosynthesis
LLPYLRAHLPHAVYVDYCHMEAPGWRDGGYPRLSLDYAAALDLQVVSSQHLKRWMRERGGDEERIAVCTTNIDTEDWNPAGYDRLALRAALGIAPDVPVVLYAARLERQKQPILAAEVMKAVARHMPGVRFLVAGDGQFAGYLRGFVRWHGLDEQVRLLGAVPNQRVRELLAISDVFFLPSQMEGISLAIYEAMAMGVTPLSADVGGQAELVAPECGVLIARGPREREEYTRALLQLLRDLAALRRMGQAARRRVAGHFRLDQMGDRMDALLGQARTLSRAQPRPPVSAPTASAAARRAIEAIREDAAEVHRIIGGNQTPRDRLRALYWTLVDRGAWWLAPLGERLRTGRE